MRRNIITPGLKIFAYSFCGLALYSAFLIRFFTPGVMVNDDIAMMSFSNGDFTGKSEFQLVFIGAIVGGILKLLSTWNSSFPWYPFFFVFVQILAGSVLLTIVFKFSRQQLSRNFFGVLSLVFLTTPVLVLDISFSTTAMYAAMCGLCSAFLSLQKPKETGFITYVAIVIVLILSSSLRADFLFAACLFLVPLYLLLYLKATRTIFLYSLIILSVVGMTHLVETNIAKSGEWGNYQQLNRLRGSMHGTPAFSSFVSSAYQEDTISKIREFGWESEDLLLFGSWYFEDSQRFNVDSLKELKKNLVDNEVSLPLQPSLENIFFGREFLIISGLLIVLTLIRVLSTRQKTLLLLHSAWFISLALYISSTSRFPDRFAVGVFFGFFTSLLISDSLFVRRNLQNGLSSNLSPTKVEVAVLSLFVLTSVFLIPHKFSADEISKRNIAEKVRLDTELDTLDQASRNGVVVFIGAQIAGEGINPWTDRTLLSGNRYLGLGWATQSPHQEKRKLLMGLGGNFVGQLVDDPKKYLLTSPTIAQLLEYSYERRMKLKIKFTEIETLTYGNLYQISTEKSAQQFDSKSLLEPSSKS